MIFIESAALRRKRLLNLAKISIEPNWHHSKDRILMFHQHIDVNPSAFAFKAKQQVRLMPL